MKVTTKGQVVIPAAIREQLGLHANTEVEFTVEGDAAVIRKARKVTGRGARLVARMAGKGTAGFTTDEIMKLMRGG